MEEELMGLYVCPPSNRSSNQVAKVILRRAQEEDGLL
jgi:hypothetical protein